MIRWITRSQHQAGESEGKSHEHEGKVGSTSADRSREQAQAEGMEGKEGICVKYLVVVHYMRKYSHEFKTTHRGFELIEDAEEFAEAMYDAESMSEIQVLIYELKKSYN